MAEYRLICLGGVDLQCTENRNTVRTISFIFAIENRKMWRIFVWCIDCIESLCLTFEKMYIFSSSAYYSVHLFNQNQRISIAFVMSAPCCPLTVFSSVLLILSSGQMHSNFPLVQFG